MIVECVYTLPEGDFVVIETRRRKESKTAFGKHVIVSTCIHYTRTSNENNWIISRARNLRNVAGRKCCKSDVAGPTRVDRCSSFVVVLQGDSSRGDQRCRSEDALHVFVGHQLKLFLTWRTIHDYESRITKQRRAADEQVSRPK